MLHNLLSHKVMRSKARSFAVPLLVSNELTGGQLRLSEKFILRVSVEVESRSLSEELASDRGVSGRVGKDQNLRLPLQS